MRVPPPGLARTRWRLKWLGVMLLVLAIIGAIILITIDAQYGEQQDTNTFRFVEIWIPRFLSDAFWAPLIVLVTAFLLRFLPGGRAAAQLAPMSRKLSNLRPERGGPQVYGFGPGALAPPSEPSAMQPGMMSSVGGMDSGQGALAGAVLAWASVLIALLVSTTLAHGQLGTAEKVTTVRLSNFTGLGVTGSDFSVNADTLDGQGDSRPVKAVRVSSPYAEYNSPLLRLSGTIARYHSEAIAQEQVASFVRVAQYGTFGPSLTLPDGTLAYPSGSGNLTAARVHGDEFITVELEDPDFQKTDAARQARVKAALPAVLDGVTKDSGRLVDTSFPWWE